LFHQINNSIFFIWSLWNRPIFAVRCLPCPTTETGVLQLTPFMSYDCNFLQAAMLKRTYLRNLNMRYYKW